MPQTILKPVFVDQRGRIQLSKTLAGQPYSIVLKQNGAIELTPVITIPAESAWLYNNPEIDASIDRAVKDIEEGRVYPLDTSGFAHEDE